ncbi:phosphoenolpyruvate carboxykinase (ATP), partial [Salmonella sp. SAL04284]|uniref:phosphoenolpyruvate carboxykinase (ATP) n=1 Tax=Salmonella sp. SAL04284 TaxID=3159862 RepID=UPI00397C2F07
MYEEAIRYDRGTCISSTGALVAYSGSKTGRSPKDKRIVKQRPSDDDVWWGPVNFPLAELSFKINRERACDYLSSRDRVYVVDGYAG